MIGAGPCPSCGASLDVEQRYCIECGHRLAAPLTLPYGTVPPIAMRTGGALPMPARVISILAVATLGFGVVVGTAMSTALERGPAAHTMKVVQVPPSPPPAPADESGAPAPPTESAPSGQVFNSPYAPGLLPSSGSYRVPKPKPPVLTGTVAHVNPVAGSYSIANGGPLLAVHAKKLPGLGTKVRTPVRTLANGTYAEDGKRKTKGNSNVASFTGTVTFRNDQAGKNYYAVSSRGSSVLVRVPADPAAPVTPPPFGSGVAVDVRLDPYQPAGPSPTGTTDTTTTTTTPAPQPTANACDADGEAVPATPPIQSAMTLTQTKISVDQLDLQTSDLEGIVQAVCPGSGQLVLSADDTRESSQDIVLGVEKGIDLSKIAVGKAIVGNATLKPPQSITLASVASDQGIKGADNTRLAQTGTAPQP